MTLNWQQLFLAERIPLFERISASLVSFLLPGTTAAGLVEFRTLNRKILKCKPNSSEASIIILHEFAAHPAYCLIDFLKAQEYNHCKLVFPVDTNTAGKEKNIRKDAT